MSINIQSKVRIVKGFLLLLQGGASLIHNQIYIPKSELSIENILIKQQETNLLFLIKLGLLSIVASKYNNIVNPRFGI